jgi:alcohol dehydrogenase YqhD (iron-dependent ADH family)
LLNFDLYTPTRILFGRGSETKVGSLLAGRAKKVLLHYGGGSIKRSGLYDRIKASLSEAGIDFTELGGVQPNPRLSLVREGIALCRREGVDWILAVGGGSVIDSAKSIAAGFYYNGDHWKLHLEGGTIDAALPVSVVLTIPAAGSEMSDNSVITNEETKQKHGFAHPLLRAVFSIINPELFFSLPKEQLAYGTVDIMSHIMERYFTPTANTDVTDGMCESLLKTILKNAPLILEDMENYDAWSELAFCGALAHNGLLGMGRAQDWASHKMEHELSAHYDVAHGAGLAVLTPFWMRYVYKENLPIFAQFAANVMGVGGGIRDMDSLAREGIARLDAFFTRMGLPKTLRDLGIGGDRLEEMAKKCTHRVSGPEQPVGGLKKMHWQDVLAVYSAAQ